MEEGGDQPYRWVPPEDVGDNPPPPMAAPNPALAQYPPPNAGALNYPPPNLQPPAPFPQRQQVQMVILQTNIWTRTSQPALCASCNQQVMTLVNYNTCNSLLPWVSCCLTCLTGCWCCCCWIPLCINECKTADHFCPQCRMLLGKRAII